MNASNSPAIVARSALSAESAGTLRGRVGRAVGWLVGAATQLLFAATVYQLYWYLAGATQRLSHPSIVLDAGLALLFAIPHSVLRLPRVQKAIGQRIGRQFYGVFYCAVTCLTLWVVFASWQSSERLIWNLHDAARLATSAAFHLSWVALAYSLCLTGLGYQTGYTEWNSWRRRAALPRRQFVPRGAYLWLRHPVYLSFAGLVWFNPQMTTDRLLLAVVWTIYLAVGSYLKDERLAFYMGGEYRRYQARVSGYPLVPWGPLAKRPLRNDPLVTPATSLAA